MSTSVTYYPSRGAFKVMLHLAYHAVLGGDAI